MTTQTAKIEKRSIIFPKVLPKLWQGADVFVRASDDTIVIKRVSKAPFWDTLEQMREIGKKFTKKDVERAITWARKSQK